MLVHENEILGDHERLLDETQATDVQSRMPDTGSSSARRIVPLILLAVVGTVFALAQTDVKEALLTGRSVAHSTSR